ncbi:PleD family two-component system response regulator [Jiella marina]|uniref:PleD family two-component system response regulator n=1 Tax=Jiella sp. LLJ827 TaxID=2917712 RepID=UPI0021011D48|nr:PleD family two-component system response regulator [Jiella sp. LLJ827]MCQ0990013.1 PleD family two-component system response regulator [Jiella sp. LLJ827]
MTARILVVDDVEINLRVLSARLTAEYFDVVAVDNGAEALAICRREAIDIVLLDVMMPDLDGFEVCRRIKADPELMHIPVVLITALDQPEDRVAGLEAGADDFLTKPVRDLPLFARVRSLVRLKRATDEWRARARTALQVTGNADEQARIDLDDSARVVAYVEEAGEGRRLVRYLGSPAAVSIADKASTFFAAVRETNAEVVVIDLSARHCDPLRLVSQLRSSDATRSIPILALAAADGEETAARALELGANDYVSRPVDRNELAARMKTQIRRKRYDDQLRRSVDETIELAVLDPLTKLHNRRFFDMHLQRAVERANGQRESFALIIADIDHFKRINDGFGHDAGDAVLREFARRLEASIRSTDLACRYGGEEFAVLMPAADAETAVAVAKRIGAEIRDTPFDIVGERLHVTVSEGLAFSSREQNQPAAILKRADAALYAAKRAGRDRLETAEDDRGKACG